MTQPQTPAGPVKHVVFLVQENHTTDNYFLSMAAYGANIATGWPVSPNPPLFDPPHDRHAYYRWLTQSTSDHVQFDTTSVLPFYAWLAASGAFLENHCSGFGTNSTPNHLLIVGGQSPTLRNPRHNTQPVWDLPSLPGLAQDNGLSWKAYTGATGYPVEFYQQLKGSANIVRSAKPSQQFLNDAANDSLPTLAMVWHDEPFDEHPTADVSLGMDAVWQAVDAVVQAGRWNETVFLLTWDDWGGFDDHVATPNVEYTPDGVQLAYGPRVPLLMFGGRVRPGIDSRWCSHVSLPKTALQLLGLPPLGVPRVDNDGGLADLVDLAGGGGTMPQPPAFGSQIRLPAPPQPTPQPAPLPPSPVAGPKLVDEVILRDGTSLGRPRDVLIRTH
ncbi:alkaline phosphatase family protein [Streptomyces sp. NPDC001851]|uniref:alkaline phosphatase family protein n=1 Tax=Streptomyces sp. NPDC001851 TaxID=3154529 RepID=UPI003329C593